MTIPYYRGALWRWVVGLTVFLQGVVAGSLFAQPADSTWLPRHRIEVHDEITLTTGYHQGRFGFAELGIGRSVYGMVHHPFGMTYYAAAEARADRPELWGIKVGAYLTGGSAFGMQVIHYMEEGRTMQVLRPEIGIGIFKARITYAYNWRLTQPRIDGISTHMVSIAYAWRIKRLRTDAFE